MYLINQLPRRLVLLAMSYDNFMLAPLCIIFLPSAIAVQFLYMELN
jgi:hypothetical protein